MSNDSLRTNQRKAIQALLNGKTKGQAAMAAGVQPGTLSRWLSQADFRDELTRLSDMLLKDAAVKLKATAETAVDVIYECMIDEDTDPGVRLRASDMMLSHVLKLVEITELQERILKLEQRLTE